MARRAWFGIGRHRPRFGRQARFKKIREIPGPGRFTPPHLASPGHTRRLLPIASESDRVRTPPRLPLTATSPAQSLLLGLLRPKRTGASATTALAEIHSGASAPHRPKACTPRNNKKAPGVDKAVRLAITGSRAVGTCDHVVTHAGYETDCGAQSVARQSVHVSRHDCILRRARRR